MLVMDWILMLCYDFISCFMVGCLLCVYASIFVGHVAIVFVQPMMSQADSGLQYWRISQCACEACFFVFVF